VWGLLAFSGCCGLSAGAQAARDGLVRGRPGRLLAALPERALGVAGLGPGFFLGSYTGVLLAATAVPLWTRGHLLMGPLFLTSAVSSATAAITLVLALLRGTSHDTMARLERLHGLALLAEVALLAALRAHLGPVLARPLEQGRLGALHRVGVIGAGLLAPLALRTASLGWGRTPRPAALLGALLTLAGGFLLRYTMVMGGRASADDPEATFLLAERHAGR
jgi:formate-dependent nitrite reductase membrane component NrfD